MPERRKRLVVLNWRDLDHPEAGGAEVVCQEFARLAASEGYEVTLLAARVEGRPKEEIKDGYKIRRNGGRFTVYAWTLAWLLVNRHQIDAVLDSQNGIPFFTPLAVRRSTPVVLLLHHIHQQQFGEYFPRPVAAVGRFLEGRACRRVYGDRAVVAVSPSTRRGARNDLRLRGEITIIPPGYGPSEWRPAERSETPEVVCVGRLAPHKRTRLIVDAMPEVLKTHPQAHLHIIGSGSELPTLQSLAEELGVQGAITFHGNCSDEIRDSLVSRAWVATTASSGEGWGISVIEANALGTPVLAFDRPGLRDSIKHGETGWLIPESPALGPALCERLSLLRDGELQKKFNAAATAWAHSFTWERMTAKLLAVFTDEECRLAEGRLERRHRSDVATVVEIPEHCVPLNWSPVLRRRDAVTREEAKVTIFLKGTDIPNSRIVLHRLGMGPRLSDGSITTRVARGSDHMLSTGVTGEGQLRPVVGSLET